MRLPLLLSIAACLCAAWAGPAEADITATYEAWGPLGPTIRVQVADSGDARVEMGGHLAAIRRGGVMYLVREDAHGTFVMTSQEFERIESRVAPEPAFLDNPPRAGEANLVEAGTEVVGGRTGIVLTTEEERRRGTSSDAAFVVSDDPDLAPVGPVMAAIFGGGTMPLPAETRSVLDQVFRRGTLIRMWVLIRLTGTSSERIPPSAFELPGPVVGGDEAYERLGRAW